MSRTTQSNDYRRDAVQTFIRFRTARLSGEKQSLPPKERDALRDQDKSQDV